jgi:hypothetical protein
MDFPNPEIALVAVVLLVAILAAHGRWGWLGWWERPLARLARRKGFAILMAATAPLLLRAILLPLYPIPQPHVQDEFSFLLGADTFAHGRVANPQHPMWVHFESMHMFARPVYASAFPAAPALAMAAGEVLLGHPWAGVWLSGGLLCGAICWMLQGWLPPRWALLGAVLAILRFGVSSYWMNSYWGGFMAAAGGALLLGALPRIMRRPNWKHAALLAAGLATMANSRPFEGLVFALIAAVWLFAWMFGPKAPPKTVVLRKIVLPIVLVLVPASAAMAYDFARITGKPWMLPYLEYSNTMAVAPHFIWMTPAPQPLYDNRQMRNFYVDWEMLCYRVSRTPFDLLRKLVYWRFYIGPLLTLPLLALPALWRDRRTRPLIWMAAGFSLGLIAQVWHNIHYAAPATGLAVLIIVLGMRRLQLWRWRGRPVGRHLVGALPAACLAMFAIQIVAGPFGANGAAPATWRWPETGGLNRARILQQLQATPQKHLVLVRYSAGHDPGDEWVYNSANIDGSQAVWARELDRTSNQKLLRYFSGRRVWLVEPDRPSPRLEPYGDAPPRLMAFVQLGAPGIDVLRSVDEVRRGVLAQAGADENSQRTCDVWNFEFSAATGVEGPDVTGCFEGGDRSRPVPFQHWFEWLKGQK